MTPDIADIIAGELKVSRGTAYDLMREALKQTEQPAAWVGLTDEEICGLIAFEGASLADFVRYVESMLRDKNAAPQPADWVGLIRGVRVDGDSVVISTKGNETARKLCEVLLKQKDAV
jgi:hypothetical protein